MAKSDEKLRFDIEGLAEAFERLCVAGVEAWCVIERQSWPVRIWKGPPHYSSRSAGKADYVACGRGLEVNAVTPMSADESEAAEIYYDFDGPVVDSAGRSTVLHPGWRSYCSFGTAGNGAIHAYDAVVRANRFTSVNWDALKPLLFPELESIAGDFAWGDVVLRVAELSELSTLTPPDWYLSLSGDDKITLESWERRHEIHRSPPITAEHEETHGEIPDRRFCTFYGFLRDSELALRWLYPRLQTASQPGGISESANGKDDNGNPAIATALREQVPPGLDYWPSSSAPLGFEFEPLYFQLSTIVVAYRRSMKAGPSDLMEGHWIESISEAVSDLSAWLRTLPFEEYFDDLNVPVIKRWSTRFRVTVADAIDILRCDPLNQDSKPLWRDLRDVFPANMAELVERIEKEFMPNIDDVRLSLYLREFGSGAEEGELDRRNSAASKEVQLSDPLTDDDREILLAMQALQAVIEKPVSGALILSRAVVSTDKKRAFDNLKRQGLVDGKRRHGRWLTKKGLEIISRIAPL